MLLYQPAKYWRKSPCREQRDISDRYMRKIMKLKMQKQVGEEDDEDSQDEEDGQDDED